MAGDCGRKKSGPPRDLRSNNGDGFKSAAVFFFVTEFREKKKKETLRFSKRRVVCENYGFLCSIVSYSNSLPPEEQEIEEEEEKIEMKRMKRSSEVFSIEEEEEEEDVETFREVVPTHYVFTIQSFSMLTKYSIETYESNEFEAGGYKWKLLLYPEGNKNENGKDDHISLYLVLAADSTSFQACSWKLKVVFRLFLFDQIRDRYLVRGGLGGRTSRFHGLKKVCGFGQFISLAKFKDPSKGYLVDDTCMFGAEVFVYKSTGYGECLTMLKDKTTANFTCRIENFSKIKKDHSSEVFKAGDEEWRILLCPNGSGVGKNNSVSLFLYCNYSENSSSDSKIQKDIFVKKVCADFIIRVRDQHHGKHINKRRVKHWFSASSSDNWGFPKFMDISVFKDQTKGFLVNDVCIVEAEVTILGVVNKLIN